MKEPKTFPVNSFKDSRGKIEFSNEFDFSEFKRFYLISPAYKNQIRAWQGHREEEKAFYAVSGKIKLVLIPVFDFESGGFGTPEERILDEENPELILVPGGFLNGFQFLTEESRLMVFSNFTLKESQYDDYRFEASKFYKWE